MNAKPPLHIHLLFHRKSEVARGLVEALLPEWMAPPGVQGTRVPVFSSPDDGSGGPPGKLDLDTAQHSLVLVLVDRHMARRVKGQGKQWAAFVRKLVGANPPGSQHHVVPVALDDKAFGLDPDELGQHHFLPLDKIDDPARMRARLSFVMSVRGLHLLRGTDDADEETRGSAPIQVFASHAKRNLDTEERLDPVGFTQRALMELPVREWFDAREIPEGAKFEEKIRAGIQHSDSMLIFLTDDWSSRPWCRDEAIMAKELQTATVIVNAMREGEIRAFPYAGNTRLLQWGAPLDPPAAPAMTQKQASKKASTEALKKGLGKKAAKKAGEKAAEKAAKLAKKHEAAHTAWRKASTTQGERAIAAAVHVALRRQHARDRLKALARKGDTVLDVEPEAARFAWENNPKATFLYPDPPLGARELAVLRGVRPNATFETPMTRFASRRGDAPLQMAVSISESPDLARLGLTDLHQRRLSDEVHLYLLLAGLRIVYGGKLDPDKLDDPDNFTLRLFSLARNYAQLAVDAGAGKLQPIVNAAPWPLWKLYNDDVYDVFGNVAELVQYPLPDIGKTDAELGALPNGFVVPKGPLQLYAWARALTHMREETTKSAAARLSIGGRIEGYKGRLPGLIEEPLLSLRAGKPLFLVGALGGCTELVIDLLEQRNRDEMTTAVAKKNIEGYDELVGLYGKLGGEWVSREQVAAEIKAAAAKGPAKALNNGLDDAANRRLFTTTDPIEIAELVLTGLGELGL